MTYRCLLTSADGVFGNLDFRRARVFGFCLLVATILNSSISMTATAQSQAHRGVDAVVGANIGTPGSFGVDRLFRALKQKGYTVENKNSVGVAKSNVVIVIGTLHDAAIKSFIKQGELPLTSSAESLAVKRIKKGSRDFLVIAGADTRGLMYALLQVSQEIEAAGNAGALDLVSEVVESPHVPVRSMVLFLHNEDDEKQWYYSKQYWEDYFSMLAANRWNTFNLVFSHQTSYMAPMYPFHVKIDKYPGVKVNGLTDEERARNMDMLQTITSMAKDRGIDFTLSVWQQIAWENSAEFPDSQDNMVSGYNKENMTDYTYLAMKEILRACPGITGLQLRLNYESGVDYDSQTAFFRDAVFRAAKESGRKILIEVRDIGLLSETLDAALATGFPTRVSHKYWAEDLVFPYHPTKFVWTYSYGDWLKYPRKADQIYQVWSLGSHRLFPWGDPEFVKRFAPTTTFGEAVGFEICAPLSQKGFGNKPGAWRIFKDPGREYYKWEYERYWSYYLLFGRMTYNPNTADPWHKEIVRRFGSEAAGDVANAYQHASQVVPHIIAVAISNYNMYVWPEKDMGGLLNYYLTLRPFDRASFSGFQEHVDNMLAGRNSGKHSPVDVAHKLDSISERIDRALDLAKAKVSNGEKEFWATEKDFRILSGMAKFFSLKMRYATKLGFYYRTADINQLRDAIALCKDALQQWKDLASTGDEIYYHDMVFGPGSAGHWKDNIAFVEDDLKQLQYQEELFELVQHADYAFDFGPTPFTRNTETYSTPYVNDYTVERRFKGVFAEDRYDPALGYGWVEAEDLKGAPETSILHRNTWSGATADELKNIPKQALLGDYVTGQKDAIFRVDLPDGHYQGTVIVTDKSVNPADHGPMEVFVVERFGDRPIIDSRVVRVGETIVKRFNINMTGERFINFRIKFKAQQGAHFIVNALTFTRVEPHIAHVPVGRAQPGKDLHQRVGVTLPPPPNDEHPLTSLGIITSNASTLDVPTDIVRVSMKYASSPAGMFRKVELRNAGKASYAGTIPATDMKAGKIVYYFEAEDNTGRIVRLPRDYAAPLFSIDVTDDFTPPSVSHTAVASHPPGKPLQVTARAADTSGVERVILHYRPTRQTMEYSSIAMDRSGDTYIAEIPGNAIGKSFDLMYYFEAFDVHGNGRIHPNREIETPYYVVKINR